MLQGGRAALGELLLHPGTVAYSWAAWRAGVPRVAPPWPVGLVTDEDEPVWAHTEPLTALHRVIETLRAGDSAPG
jgi:hypothetical protein